MRQCYEEMAEIMLDHFRQKGRVFVLNGNPGKTFLTCWMLNTSYQLLLLSTALYTALYAQYILVNLLSRKKRLDKADSRCK